MSERIQKLLATAGIASRRAIEEWIALGRITVNGRPAEVGQKIAHDDHVRVDGRLVALARKPVAPRVLLFRKKTGELVTRDDPEGRRTVFRKLPELETGRWIAVGRLDINTSGLLLMTNDGELARRLTHPSFEIKRVYAVRVLGELTDDIRRRLLSGVQLDDGPARCEKLVDVDPPDLEDGEPGGANRWYEVTMGEGRNRIVRRLFETEGLQVSRLIRIAYGPVALGRGIKAGSYREATAEELNALLQAVRMSPLPAPGRGPKRSAPRRPRGEIDDVEVRPVPAGKRATAGSVRGNVLEPPRARPAGGRVAARGQPRKPAPARDSRPQSAGRSKHRTASAAGSVGEAGGAAFKPGRAASRRARPGAEEPAPPRRFERADRAAQRAPESSRPAPSSPAGGRRDPRAGGGGNAKGGGRAPSVKGDSASASRRQGGVDSRAAAKSGRRSPSKPGGRRGGKPGAARRPPKKPGR